MSPFLVALLATGSVTAICAVSYAWVFVCAKYVENKVASLTLALSPFLAAIFGAFYFLGRAQS